MKRGSIPMMTAAELERLPTKQLLARLVQLRQCEKSASLSDSGEDGAWFKDSAEWSAAYEQLKAILARREHVAKGVELVGRRKRRAKLAQTLDHRAGRRT
jgi:hypothetical protein